ncbi:hypothetical protein BDV97DRAFT_355820 [Delphinella strobiligena]|nr:hypothetical protein BDV97DRAFT_355820 [Delphinella strobiligena]
MQFALISTLALAAMATAETISVTPQVEYSSSIGVLGCKINTNRVAYWPSEPDCNNICVRVTYGDNSLNLLRVDSSGSGTHDISYDAWNTLSTGKSAIVDPTEGGGIDMDYEGVDMSECSDLIYTDDGTLAFEAANSINFIASCINEPSTWIAQKYSLWNIANAVCTLGVNEKCTFDLATSNDPVCPHTLGLQTPLEGMAVTNIAYGTGERVVATQ